MHLVETRWRGSSCTSWPTLLKVVTEGIRAWSAGVAGSIISVLLPDAWSKGLWTMEQEPSAGTPRSQSRGQEVGWALAVVGHRWAAGFYKRQSLGTNWGQKQPNSMIPEQGARTEFMIQDKVTNSRENKVHGRKLSPKDKPRSQVGGKGPDAHQEESWVIHYAPTLYSCYSHPP